MADEITLIHAGLPWNNPQKITVKADQYISQLVINRGLLNLLSNDYYLDLKTERINQYLLQLVDPHIRNSFQNHWTEQQIIDIIQRFLNGQMGSFIEGFGLVSDTVYVIPYNSSQSSTKNLNRIQNIIDACPRNLNGKTAVFALTPVITSDNTYTKSINDWKRKKDNLDTNLSIFQDPITINTMSRSISFNSFYGGTLIFLGNKYFICTSSNDARALTPKESRLMLQEIQKELQTTQIKNITITGNGNNNSCSIVSFNNCLCDTFIWNLGISISSNASNEDDYVEFLPQKKSLSLFFPADTKNDTITGDVRNIKAGAINKQDFSNISILLRSMNQTLTEMPFGSEENLNYAINLNNDYLKIQGIEDKFRQAFFGNYVEDNEIKPDPLYTGASLGFWLSGNFYQSNITEVPILYSVDTAGNGFYIGLDKIATITEGKIDTSNYIDTTFASKKKEDLNDKWVYWSINFNKIDPASISSYYVTMSYTPYGSNTVSVLPNANSNDTHQSLINLKHLNFGNPIYLFGNNTTAFNFNIRNILMFNQMLTKENANAIAKYGIEEVYNFNDSSVGKTFINNMKGAIYAYNCPSINVIECNLEKV